VQVEFGGLGGRKDFHAIRGGFSTLCRWNSGLWVAGRTFMPSGVDLVHCAGGISGSGWREGLSCHQGWIWYTVQIDFGGVGGGKDFHAMRGRFGTLCRWNLGVWVAGRTFMPSGVDLVHCAGGI
jgi:hypothetical protein